MFLGFLWGVCFVGVIFLGFSRLLILFLGFSWDLAQKDGPGDQRFCFVMIGDVLFKAVLGIITSLSTGCALRH